ncbi:DNA-binding transcriptional activator BglJ, partial [Escherichia coli]|uniref:DNA-binding transcriptional activator BglJ n=1 Tax=Escherichia coli TaxID=562 RepID=UPI002078D775
MEHSRIKKRNVALIEKCVMSSIGIESLFRKFAGNPYKLHTYTSQESFQDAMSRISFAAVIFSFSAMRSERREGLSCLTELAIKFPRTRRLVIADDDIEARLIGSLSPSPLDGVLSKASTLEIFHQELFLSLNGVRQATDRLNNQWYINQSRTLSPTEREILRFRVYFRFHAEYCSQQSWGHHLFWCALRHNMSVCHYHQLIAVPA